MTHFRARRRLTTLESFGAWMFTWGVVAGCIVGYVLRWIGV